MAGNLTQIMVELPQLTQAEFPAKYQKAGIKSNYGYSNPI
jgi:hypothetical protein